MKYNTSAKQVDGALIEALVSAWPTPCAKAGVMTHKDPSMKRRVAVIVSLLAVAGCAVDRGPLKLPDPIPLISPAPGMAVVYLLRVPRESFDLQVQVNGARVAVLAKETFTAIALAPGSYELLAERPGASLPSEVSRLTVAAGERRFLYSAIPTRGSDGIGFVPLPGGILPVPTPIQTAIGARRWTELSESDAQGMFSVLKPVAAEVHVP